MLRANPFAVIRFREPDRNSTRAQRNYNRFFSEPGGLISYGDVHSEQFRLAAGYIDRILKGEKPADPPLQAPPKYKLVINLKTAKALSIEVPPSLLAIADEVIE